MITIEMIRRARRCGCDRCQKEADEMEREYLEGLEKIAASEEKSDGK